MHYRIIQRPLSLLLLYTTTTTQANSWQQIDALENCVDQVLENSDGNLWRHEWANIVYFAACEDRDYSNEECTTLWDEDHVKWNTLPESVQDEFCDEACDIDDADCDENSCDEDGSERVRLSRVDAEEREDIADDLCNNAADHWNDIVESLVQVYDNVYGDDSDSDDNALYCTDLPNWVDEFGDDCAEYKAQDWCAEHSDCCPNPDSGIASGEACCVCGGGVIVAATTNSPSQAAVVTSNAPSNVNVDPGTVCVDIPDWADEFGDDCAEYEAQDWCEEYRDCCANPDSNITSGTACCVCGGGTIVNNLEPSPGPSVANLAVEESFNMEFGFGVVVEDSVTAVQVLEDGIGDAILDHLYNLVGGVLTNLARRRLQTAQLVGIQYTGVTVKDEEDCSSSSTMTSNTCVDMTTRITLQSDGSMTNDDVSNAVRSALTVNQTEGMFYANDVPGLTSNSNDATTSTAATNDDNKSNSSEIGKGNVLYIILAVVIAVSITCLILFFLHRRSKQNVCGASNKNKDDDSIYETHIDTHLNKAYNGSGGVSVATHTPSVNIAQSVSDDVGGGGEDNMEVTIEENATNTTGAMMLDHNHSPYRPVTPDRSVESNARSVGSPSTVGLNAYTQEYGIQAMSPNARSSAAAVANSPVVSAMRSSPVRRSAPGTPVNHNVAVVDNLVDTDVTLNDAALSGSPSKYAANTKLAENEEVKVKRSVSWADPQLVVQPAFGGDWGRPPSPGSTTENGGNGSDAYNGLSPTSDDDDETLQSDMMTASPPALQQASSYTDQAIMALSSMVAGDDLCRVISNQVQNLAGAPIIGVAGQNHEDEEMDECDTWQTNDTDTITTAPSLGEYRRSGGISNSTNKGEAVASNNDLNLNYDAVHNPGPVPFSRVPSASLSIPLPTHNSSNTNALPSLKEEVGSDSDEEDLDNDSLLADSITNSPAMITTKKVPMGREHSTLTQQTTKTTNTTGTAQMSNTRSAVRKRNTFPTNDALNISGLSAVPEDDVSVDIDNRPKRVVATPFDEGEDEDDASSEDDLGSLGELSSLGGGSSVNVYAPQQAQSRSAPQAQAQAQAQSNGDDASKSEFNDWLQGEIDTLKQTGSWTKIEELIESTDGDNPGAAAGGIGKQRSYNRPISPTHGNGQSRNRNGGSNKDWEDSSSSDSSGSSDEDGDMLPSLPVVRKMYT